MLYDLYQFLTIYIPQNCLYNFLYAVIKFIRSKSGRKKKKNGESFFLIIFGSKVRKM